MSKQIRFAPLIRVSGEEQARTGESLRTQQQQIDSAVKAAGGIIPPLLAERYCGQEHATPGYERAKLDQLLKDAEADLYDAVIIADMSRWSRDNEKSRAGLKVLRKHGKRFFVLTTEHDLNNAEAQLVLGMFSQINQYLTHTQIKKSTDNRLGRLRRGHPACGSLPYGRTFNKETETWGIDPDAQRFIQTVAQRYTAGESLEAMSKELQVSTTTIWHNLVKQSGPEFVVAWNKAKPDEDNKKRVRHQGLKLENLVTKHRKQAKRVNHNVQEIELDDMFIFLIDIPPLLDTKTLERVHVIAHSRRKNRGPRKHDYLIRNYIYCGDCGKSLTGQSQDRPERSLRYYRHSSSKRLSGSQCKQCMMFVDADAIEQAILLHLFANLGNATKIKAAIDAANPDIDEQAAARQEIQDKTAELKKIDAAKDRVIDAVADGKLIGDAISKKMSALTASEDACKARIELLTARIGNAPAPSLVQDAAASLAKRRSIIRGAMDADELSQMSFQDKRELMDLFFLGWGPAGETLGVFVKRPADWQCRGRTDRRWLFEIKGRFTIEPESDTAPLTAKQEARLRGQMDNGIAATNLKTIYASLSPKYAARNK